MLTRMHKQAGIRGGRPKAHVWPCMPETRRGRMTPAVVGVCLSSSSGYSLGGQPELKGAASIENPRFADQNENQI